MTTEKQQMITTPDLPDKELIILDNNGQMIILDNPNLDCFADYRYTVFKFETVTVKSKSREVWKKWRFDGLTPPGTWGNALWHALSKVKNEIQ